MNHGYDLIDLSVPLADNAVSEPFPATIEYIDHQQGGEQMQELFPEMLIQKYLILK